VSEKERDEVEDVVFAMVLCVSDPETDEEDEEVGEREREEAEEVWEREKFERGWYCVWEIESENKIVWDWFLLDLFFNLQNSERLTRSHIFLL